MPEISPGLIVSLVPQDRVEAYWPAAARLIEPALDVAPGRSSLNAILRQLRRGTQSLWVVMRNKSVIAAFVTKVYDNPRCRICSIEWFGGKDMADWIDSIGIVENFARDVGCQRIEVHGRKGWVRTFEKHGWKLRYCAHEKVLSG